MQPPLSLEICTSSSTISSRTRPILQITSIWPVLSSIRSVVVSLHLTLKTKRNTKLNFCIGGFCDLKQENSYATAFAGLVEQR